MSHDCYNFHDVSLEICGDESAVLAGIRSRLKLFLQPELKATDIRFEIRLVPDPRAHVVEKPNGPSRHVYDPPIGEVVYYDAEDKLYIEYRDAVRVLCDLPAGHVSVSALQSEARGWLLTHPMFTLPFIEFLKRRARYSVHAAGLSIDGRGVLLPGNSGSGKTTLSIVLLRAGFDFLGDDMMFLKDTDKGLRVLAFPDELDVTDETAMFFPELHGLLHQTTRATKRSVRPEDIYETKFAWECDPKVLIFPEVATNAKSKIDAMDKDAAFLELVPNVLLTEKPASQRHLDALSSLVKKCECYRFSSGREFEAIPSMIREIVR